MGKILQMTLTLGRRRVHPRVRIVTLEPTRRFSWRGSVFGDSALQALFAVTRSLELQALDNLTTRFSGSLGIVLGRLLQTRLRPRYSRLNGTFQERCAQGALDRP